VVKKIMGVKDFKLIFDGKERSLDSLGNAKIAFDVATDIYASATIAAGPRNLTSKDGKPTMFLVTMINKLISQLQRKCRPIYVFDYRGKKGEKYHIPEKQDTLDTRNARKKIAQKKLKKETDKTKRKALERQTFTPTYEIIDEVQMMLDAFGVPWVHAPKGVEAEQYAAWLNNSGVVDIVVSADTDAVAFGAKTVWRQTSKKENGKKRGFFLVYERDEVIEQVAEKTKIEDPTIADVRKICAMLGTDFSVRTRGVGPATLKRSVHQRELDPELGQQRAFDIFSREERIDKRKFKLPRFRDGIYAALDKERLFDYFDDLSERLGFNGSRWKDRALTLFGEKTRKQKLISANKKMKSLDAGKHRRKTSVDDSDEDEEEEAPVRRQRYKKKPKKAEVEFPSSGEDDDSD
jgi:5'-3' exonuclease